MNIINTIFSTIDWIMSTPNLFGWFHILSLILMIVVIIMIAKAIKKDPDRTVKNAILLFCIITVILELIKQGLFTYVASEYQWYAFPFQFCSTPIYITFLSLIIKNSKIKEALYSFLALFGLFGGLIVMVYPGDVFTDLVIINIQTMVHHAGMVIIGVTLILSKKVSLDYKALIKATIVFLFLLIVAQIMNFVAHYSNIGTFNMFFISPFGTNHLPVLSNIQNNQPYLIFLSSYIIGFVFAAFLIQKVCLLLQNCYITFCNLYSKIESNKVLD